MGISLLLLALSCAASTALAGTPTLEALKWRSRVVLVASARPDTAEVVQQHRILQNWSRGAVERDVVEVDVVGSHVIGAADQAAELRARYHLDRIPFEVLLIGKDGHVALRAMRLITAEHLERIIDAMPMRQAGER